MSDREEGVVGGRRREEAGEGDRAEEREGEEREKKNEARATLQEQRLKISINGRIVLKDNLTRG